MPVSHRNKNQRCNDSTMRTWHHHFMRAMHKVGNIRYLYFIGHFDKISNFYQVAFGTGLSKKKLTSERRLETYKNYLKDQAKYILNNPNKAYSHENF